MMVSLAGGLPLSSRLRFRGEHAPVGPESENLLEELSFGWRETLRHGVKGSQFMNQLLQKSSSQSPLRLFASAVVRSADVRSDFVRSAFMRSAMVLPLTFSAGCLVRGESPELVLKGSVAESSEVVKLDPVFLSRQRQIEARFFGFDTVGSGTVQASGRALPSRAGMASSAVTFSEEGNEAISEDEVDVSVGPENSAAQARALASSPDTFGFALRWPVLGHITSPFGMRHGRLHAGLDIKGGKGEPIYAAADGQVLTAKRKNAYGIVAVIGHDNDHQTLYGHMLRLAVREGEYVKSGEVIGYVGRTGRATGFHLHFETRVAGGIPQDPMRFLPDVKRSQKVSEALTAPTDVWQQLQAFGPVQPRVLR